MKYLKRFLFIMFIMMGLLSFINVSATTNTQYIKVGGSSDSNAEYVTYANSNEKVEINAEYDLDCEFRACWVSGLVGDVSRYSSKQQYQTELTRILDKMQSYNLNVLIFHIRIMNDAFYPSQYAKYSIYYSTNPDWDFLPWLIDECHKRGIEFHAWMNPYRVCKSSGNTDLVNLSRQFDSNNMASDPDNLLQGANSVILNPGIPEIRDWLVNVCMEVIQNYDVDAIHFDDYFYDSGVDDTATRNKYNTEGLTLGDFRREQVNLFIQALSNRMRLYNQFNKKRVQLGISPSGVYRGGDGKVYYDEATGMVSSTGSLTRTSFIHYDAYLYSDTLYWINMEWIDYILPQAYWAIEHPLCPYVDLMKWWGEVCSYKNVKCYAGMGIYQKYSASAYSWNTSDLEAYYQIMVANTLKGVDGVSLYCYNYIDRVMNKINSNGGLNKLWNTPAVLPEITTMSPLNVDKPSNLMVTRLGNNNKLLFNNDDNAKFYVIYRSEVPFEGDPSLDKVIAITSDCTGSSLNYYLDKTSDPNKTYYYAVKSQSYSLKLSEASYINTIDIQEEDKVTIEKITNFGIVKQEVSNNVNKVTMVFNTLLNRTGNYYLQYSTDGIMWNDYKVQPDFDFSNTVLNYYFTVDVDSTESLYFRVCYRFEKAFSKTDDVLYTPIGITSDLGIMFNNESPKSSYTLYPNNTVEIKFDNFDIDGLNLEKFVAYSTDNKTYSNINKYDNTTITNITTNKVTVNFSINNKSFKIYLKVVIRDAATGYYYDSDVIEVKCCIEDFFLDEVINYSLDELSAVRNKMNLYK